LLSKLIIINFIIFCQSCVMFNSVKLPGSDRAGSMHEEVVVSGDRSKVLIIPIDGVISEDSVRGGNILLGEDARPSMVSYVIDVLDRAKRDRYVNGIILKINSPGGTVTASEIIYREILKFKKDTGIPVVAMFMGIAASGGYYVAMSSDKIVAFPSGVTGSIGVIMQRFNVKEGLDKLGIKEQSITSGENKKIGSPFVDLKPEQEKILKGIVNDMYEQFFTVVKNNRKSVSSTRLRELADGRIFSSPEALKEGLVDSVGYFDDSVNTLTKQEKYLGSSRPTIVYYTFYNQPVRSPYQISYGGQDEISVEQILKSHLHSRFFYLWSY
jgi:protease IV